eukprot:gene20894-22945_t
MEVEILFIPRQALPTISPQKRVLPETASESTTVCPTKSAESQCKEILKELNALQDSPNVRAEIEQESTGAYNPKHVGKVGQIKSLTEETFRKLVERRRQWLALPDSYKNFTEVAKESLNFVSDEIESIEQLESLYYHVACYRSFTDITKIDRALKSFTKTKTAKKLEDTEVLPIPKKCSQEKQ